MYVPVKITIIRLSDLKCKNKMLIIFLMIKIEFHLFNKFNTYKICAHDLSTKHDNASHGLHSIFWHIAIFTNTII